MPFAEYQDFEDCVSKNQQAKDPAAYCAVIKSKTEKEKMSLNKKLRKEHFNKLNSLHEKVCKEVTLLNKGDLVTYKGKDYKIVEELANDYTLEDKDKKQITIEKSLLESVSKENLKSNWNKLSSSDKKEVKDFIRNGMNKGFDMDTIAKTFNSEWNYKAGDEEFLKEEDVKFVMSMIQKESVHKEGANDNAMLTKTFQQIRKDVSADDVRNLVSETISSLNAIKPKNKESVSDEVLGKANEMRKQGKSDEQVEEYIYSQIKDVGEAEKVFSLIEKVQKEGLSLDDEEASYVEIDTDEGLVTYEKRGTNWFDDKGGKYMSYLTPRDLKSYANKDFGGAVVRSIESLKVGTLVKVGEQKGVILSIVKESAMVDVEGSIMEFNRESLRELKEGSWPVNMHDIAAAYKKDNNNMSGNEDYENIDSWLDLYAQDKNIEDRFDDVDKRNLVKAFAKIGIKTK